MNDFQKEMQTQCWWMIALSAAVLLLFVYVTLSIQSAPKMAVVLAVLGIAPLISVLYQGTHASDSAKWIAVLMLMVFLPFAAFVWSN